MGVNLQKGQRISLDKEANGSLTRIVMGLGWDAAKAKTSGFLGSLFGGGGGGNIDLDASCLLFDEQGNLVDAVWFRQLRSRDGSIQHTGDNLTGEGEGDDEQIIVDLPKVPATVKSLVFTVNNYTGQDFSRVENAFCRIVNAADDKELARYDLSCQGNHTAMIMAKVYRHNDEWKMHAIGETGQGRTFEQLLPQIRPHL
ncbi:TerD family protein [Methylocaldum szegediense]|uniref:Tellurium resistance protein TerZ n=1 Tax=Methylocaldum szegediense TaxID=73780 RepID=A0ABM9I4C7_9GAMM|nr:TerD family protein [Methylocaldum szegediense]CAI8878764.1 Tellurium resistance protein TerZ [Methylocaldum szegediense]